MNAKQEEARQRRADMTTLEVRRRVGGPWLRVRDIAPEIVARVVPSSDGVVDERIILAWGLSAGELEWRRHLDPECPLAFRLSGQFRDQGGWQITRAGAQRIVKMLLAA